MKKTSGNKPPRLENLSPLKKVIPLTYKNGDFWHTDIKLPDLVLINPDQESLSVKAITIQGQSQGREMIHLTQDQNTVEETARGIHPILNKLLKSDSVWSAYNLGMLFGKMAPAPACACRICFPFIMSGFQKLTGRSVRSRSGTAAVSIKPLSTRST